MGGSVSLPLTVEIAFAAGALDTGTLTWTDVTTYVRKDSISFNRGWDTESQEPIAGRASLSFNNESGNFTPGKTGAFGLIRNRLPIRIKQGATVLWTGLVESWRIGWTNGMRSKVDVTCVDRWAALRRLKIAANRLEAATTALAVDYFWPCTDESGGVRGSKDSTPAMTNAGGSVEDLVYGGDTHPIDSSRSVVQWRPTVSGSTASLESALYADSVTLASGLTVALFGSVEDLLANGKATFKFGFVNAAGSDEAYVELGFVDALGVFNGTFSLVRDGVSVNSVMFTVTKKTWTGMVVAFSRSGGDIVATYSANGGSVFTWPATSAADFGSASNYRAGLYYDSRMGRSSIAGAAVFKRALSAAEVKWLSGQIGGGDKLAPAWAGDTADSRATRIARYGPATLSTTGTFTIPMSKQDLADKPLADALLECAQAEDGALFIDTSGWPKITSRSWRTQATVAFTIPAKALASDIGWTLDDQQLTNSAAVDRMVGDATAGTATGRNDASVALYGEQKVSRQLWLYNTADAVERANAEANMWANPLPRSSELTVDLMTKGVTISAATLLAADIGQRIAISGMPAEAPTQTNFYIEAISDNVTETQWLRTFTVSPRLDFLTLDDASSGAIDSTFVLAP